MKKNLVKFITHSRVKSCWKILTNLELVIEDFCRVSWPSNQTTSIAVGQDHGTCPGVSSSFKQVGQIGAATIFLVKREIFVGRELVQALHMKFLTALKQGRDHICFQQASNSPLFEDCPWLVVWRDVQMVSTLPRENTIPQKPVRSRIYTNRNL